MIEETQDLVMGDAADRKVADHLYRLRHSCAHVMAEAVLKLFPSAKLAIGPPITDGFYYDFDLPRTLTPSDIERIEEIMVHIIGGSHPFIRAIIDRKVVKEQFSEQLYKLELIDGLAEDEEISIYTQNTFTDLCRGPHLRDTGELNASAFKLISISGAYWRGDEKRPMLSRIYGTVWDTDEELTAYLERKEEIERRDHRRLGRELGLFSIQEKVGPGLIFWHPKGAQVRSLIEDFWRKRHYEGGYELVSTPHIGRENLWKRSGHLDFYKENTPTNQEFT